MCPKRQNQCFRIAKCMMIHWEAPCSHHCIIELKRKKGNKYWVFHHFSADIFCLIQSQCHFHKAARGAIPLGRSPLYRSIESTGETIPHLQDGCYLWGRWVYHRSRRRWCEHWSARRNDEIPKFAAVDRVEEACSDYQYRTTKWSYRPHPGSVCQTFGMTRAEYEETREDWE